LLEKQQIAKKEGQIYYLVSRSFHASAAEAKLRRNPNHFSPSIKKGLPKLAAPNCAKINKAVN